MVATIDYLNCSLQGIPKEGLKLMLADLQNELIRMLSGARRLNSRSSWRA